MNLTQEQIKEILLEIANEKDGFNVIMKMSLEVLMKSERKMFQEETGVSANGFRPRRIQGFGKEIALSVPRTRTGEFYPVLLSVIRAENEEHQKLICNLYTKGLTTEQISNVYEDVYGKSYSKSQISHLMNSAREEADIWLKRELEAHYLVVYIDATFVSTRRDQSVKKEAYYSILGIRVDGTREVLAVVNHPTEGSNLWQLAFEDLKERGVKSIGLVVSDGLTSIENAVVKSMPGTAHQLCVVHFKRNIMALFPYKLRPQIGEELKEVFPIETDEYSPLQAFERLQLFVSKWKSKYPSIKSFSKERSIYYFTYLLYPPNIQRMIYTTNWIERLNRDYKRTLKMRGAMPSPESVLFLIGSVAMEKTAGSYSYPVAAFREIEKLQPKNQINEQEHEK
jgi:putative transposase